jgi:hypothetical protein
MAIVRQIEDPEEICLESMLVRIRPSRDIRQHLDNHVVSFSLI